MRHLILSIIVATIFVACRKDATIYPDKPAAQQGVAILAHKAGGGGNNPYQENTLQAAIYGFSHLDGIEVDIQKSRDGTLWLYHDEVIENSDGKDKRIPGLTDNEIKAIMKHRQLTLNTLEEILEWQTAYNNTEKISLDIKSWLPTRFSNTQGYLVEVADAIGALAKKYNCGNRLLAECENATCLKRLEEKDASIQTFLTTFGDFDKGTYRALKGNFNGISFKYQDGNLSAEQIELLHKKGLHIQLWIINDSSGIVKAKNLLPDYIQTDNVKWQ
ncbi:MAG: glycerophosphodiester phosphodiesterase [Bacteroidota bacterium]